MSKIAKCTHCGDNMGIIRVDKYNRPHGAALIAIGFLFLIALPVEAILSLVLLPFGIVVFFSKKEVWCCPSCSSIAEMAHKKLN
ncbi:MAG: hypothetical protein HQK51_12340 [Oligoflexia bacterium]|nr:hypothetical protein [Oligoflexia bacterium]